MKSAIFGAALLPNGAVTIPEDVQKEMGLKKGTRFLVCREEDVLILKVAKPLPRRKVAQLLKKAQEIELAEVLSK